MSFRVAFQTFGCKLNQLETESLADEFRRRGATIVGLGEEAELYVLNTCTVTSKAEQKARRLLRSILAERPAAFAVVTGCYAQLEPEAIAELEPEGRLIVVRGEEKAEILSLADFLGESCGSPAELPDLVREWREASAGPWAARDKFAFRPESFSFHSRPSLKIEDGCNNRCSYCRVCLARGKAVSLAAPEVLSRLRALEEAGAPEVVLAGVNLSHYRSGDLDFPGLLRYLLDRTERVALRLSSYEPDRLDSAFLEAFADPRVRPHVHLAIQSGSNSVLARMGRAYRREEVLAACEALRRVRRDPFLACDLIVGFPGETEAEFADTAALAREAGFAWIHAFQYSPRPGTKAWDMRPRVPERVAGERAAVLGELAREGRAAYLSRWLGSEVSAVLERGSVGDEDEEEGAAPSGPAPAEVLSPSRAPSLCRATSENYLKLLVSLPEGAEPERFKPGREVTCRLAPSLPEKSPRGVDAEAVFLN